MSSLDFASPALDIDILHSPTTFRPSHSLLECSVLLGPTDFIASSVPRSGHPCGGFPEAPPGPPPPIPDIVFEDSDILVVNKPSGMLVHPSGDTFTWTVITLCKMKYTEHCLDLAHRLDRETSGTLIITKNKKSNAFMKKQLETIDHMRGKLKLLLTVDRHITETLYRNIYTCTN